MSPNGSVSNGFALLEQFNRAFNRHDVDGMMDLMSADCVFENTYPPPDGARYEGAQAVRGFWEEFFRAAPRARLDIEELYASGGRGFQRWVYSWGEGRVRGVDLFRFEDGKIAEKLSYVKG